MARTHGSRLLFLLLLIGMFGRYQYYQKHCQLSPHYLERSFSLLDVSGGGWRKINLRNMVANRSTSMKTAFLVTLLLSGDIQLNPGPGTKYPCTICYKPVKANQMALECDGCLKWTHCKCCGVGKDVYQSYQNESTLQWHCPRCLAQSLPFNDCSRVSSDSQGSLLCAVANDDEPVPCTPLPPNNSTSSIQLAH